MPHCRRDPPFLAALCVPPARQLAAAGDSNAKRCPHEGLPPSTVASFEILPGGCAFRELLICPLGVGLLPLQDQSLLSEALAFYRQAAGRQQQGAHKAAGLPLLQRSPAPVLAVPPPLRACLPACSCCPCCERAHLLMGICVAGSAAGCTCRRLSSAFQLRLASPTAAAGGPPSLPLPDPPTKEICVLPVRGRGAALRAVLLPRLAPLPPPRKGRGVEGERKLRLRCCSLLCMRAAEAQGRLPARFRMESNRGSACQINESYC